DPPEVLEKEQWRSKRRMRAFRYQATQSLQVVPSGRQRRQAIPRLSRAHYHGDLDNFLRMRILVLAMHLIWIQARIGSPIGRESECEVTGRTFSAGKSTVAGHWPHRAAPPWR